MDVLEEFRRITKAQMSDPPTYGDMVRLSAIEQIERLRAALEPFAEVARWAERNGHDLSKDYDMLLRGPGKIMAGHLQVQAPHFIGAKQILD